MQTCVSIAAGDHRRGVEARRNALIETHLDLVRTIALALSRSLPRAFELDDLISAGYLGLIRAATNYRPRVHNGTPFSAYARPVVRGAILDSVRRRPWLDATLRVSGDDVLEPASAPDYEQELDHAAVVARVDAAVSQLPARLRKVVRSHYGADERLPVVARSLRVGKSRASQLHCEALRILRQELAG